MSFIRRGEKAAVLQVLYKRDGPRCCWCERKLLPLDSLPKISSGNLPVNYPTIDHLIPQCMGGPHLMFNYKVSCPKCNSTRHKEEDGVKSQNGNRN